jgi:hypothetical protein
MPIEAAERRDHRRYQSIAVTQELGGVFAGPYGLFALTFALPPSVLPAVGKVLGEHDAGEPEEGYDQRNPRWVLLPSANHEGLLSTKGEAMRPP